VAGWLPDGSERWGGQPGAFDAWLDDGTGSAVVRWLGREPVPGIVGGVRLTVEGAVSEVAGQLAILNPMYRFEADA
jgi:CRISPR/Cas system endoribonuclease Cas6 (RAMP superfamily)